ncbi:SDR family NAD(P)-dependent oxidoreductase [Modestobacter roseus]|uniref:Short-subunit dehydrogenase n=1 Tax=Modestobacter roseus TaxID=1181884 RepID=A0A562ITT6_9ACTN|nr:SDR family NAD(P)-dependent oxidoreductase [Modestobacter roseus]MQA33249.1 SDR family NAD(P)-dependent oxidoreductase [Modestobacter roseus]TWH74173.1 short-subunit dehydrogenase [Modestobacter roseus]
MTSSGAVLLLGGRSEIGLEVTERLVRAGAGPVVLAARRHQDLDDQEHRLRAAGSTAVTRVEFDADDVASHGDLLAGVLRDVPPGDVVVVLAFGVLGDQRLAEEDAAAAVATVHTDLVAQVSVLTHLARLLRVRGQGRLVVFSSIAGFRVRRANYVYGAAKAGLDGFACGLADALHGSGVQLLLVRPGFVVGRMTAGMTPAPLSSTPAQVADAVVDGLRRGRSVVWVPGSLRLLAAVFAVLPRAIWRRLPR